MSSTPLILVAGLIDPIVGFELLALHMLILMISISVIESRVKAPKGIIVLCSIGVTSLFFIMNLLLFNLLGWTAIQDPVVMWYTR